MDKMIIDDTPTICYQSIWCGHVCSKCECYDCCDKKMEIKCAAKIFKINT